MLKDEIINEVRKETDMAITHNDGENVISYNKLEEILNKYIPECVINIFKDGGKN